MKYELKAIMPQADSNVEAVLRARGVENIDGYLIPGPEYLLDPLLLDNMDKGADLLFETLESKKTIFLLVDSDVDGYFSASMLYNYISIISPETKIIVHHHTGKQHGLAGIEVPDEADLVLVPDAGSNDNKEIEELYTRGKKVLLLDHHHTENYPTQGILINNQLSERYPNKDLTGAGVVYKFLQYFDEQFGYTYANDFLDLAAVGIIADMASLLHLETRYITHKGLNTIRNGALLALMAKNTYLRGNSDTLSPTDVSFSIAPFFNAIARVGTQEEKELAFLALTDSYLELPSTKRGHKPGDIELAGEQFARVATNVKARQQRLVDNAMAILQNRIAKHGLDDNQILVVFTKPEDDFNTNITGLIAMKLAAHYQKPTILVKKGADGVYKGSLRGLNDIELDDFRGYLEGTELVEWARG